MEFMRKHVEWLANGSQSLIAAILLAWGIFQVSTTLGESGNSKRLIALIVALVLLSPVLYSLLGNAVLIALRGLNVIKPNDGFDEVEKLGKGTQIQVLIAVFAFVAILLPFSVLEFFDDHQIAYSISLGAVFGFWALLPVVSRRLFRKAQE